MKLHPILPLHSEARRLSPSSGFLSSLRSALPPLLLLCGALPAPVASAAELDLGSTLHGRGFVAEHTLSGAFARIDIGTGQPGDSDGLYLIGGSDPASAINPVFLGSGIDLFPREEHFSVGTLSYDPGLLAGSGVEVLPVGSLDLSGLWTSDPARGDPLATGATVTSDLSDYALGLWFLGSPGALRFSALDASDTLTFEDGRLSSIDLIVDADFEVVLFGSPVVWSGTLSFSGAMISLLIDDVAATPVGDSRLQIQLEGTVDAVSAIPEPSFLSLALGCVVLCGILARARLAAAAAPSRT